MKQADPAGPQGQEDQRKPKTWGERISDWFRRTTERERPPSAKPSILVEWSSLPLSASELDTLRTFYLDRLRKQLHPLYLYGLDARRRSLQESGQSLDLQALYTPLNTTRQVPVDPQPEDQAGDAAPGRCKMRPLTLLEAVGRERHAIVRGPNGAGKSTFLRFLALCLAGEAEQDQAAGLARLQPAWTHGSLFPIWAQLGDFVHSACDDGTADGLCAYIAADLEIGPDQLRNQLIAAGGLLFLLDDADLAPEAVVDLMVRLEDTANYCILTCPDYADPIPELEPLSASWTSISLAPWGTEDMDAFVRRWYAELERKEWLDAEAVRDLPGQLRSSLRHAEISTLAGRPGLLTLVALLQTLRGRLPADRLVFYQEFLNLTVTRWCEGTTEDERDLRQALDPGDLCMALAQTTFDEYDHLEKAGGRVELAESDLRATLVTYCKEGRWEAVGDFIARIRSRPGFLEERTSGVYIYPDTSLQAHVASRYLAAQPELPRLIVRLATDDFHRWREVILFTVARCARLQKDAPAALILVDALCPRSLSASEQHQVAASEWRLAWLAGDALNEVVAERLPAAKAPAALPRGEPALFVDTTQTLSRIQQWLVALLERGMLRPWERAQAGEALDRLGNGDPRPGLSLPEPLWCEVPAGPFWRGEGEEGHLVDLGPFWIARYPVTNAQYASFVSATRHRPPAHWQGDRPPAGMGNHPVVNVTWEDAVQCCKWWTEYLRAARSRMWRSGEIESAGAMPMSWTVRLPTSAEWEKAARGGVQIPGPRSGELIENPLPRRIYPWGDSWRLSIGEILGDETRCNVSESDIGTTTPAGIYPDGASPYGIMDMAGNVWEWCLDWATTEQRYKIRRGGAYRYTHEQARCAAYDKAYPSLAWPYVGFRIVLGPPASETGAR
jgi:formylglycine-generating enzyme required for sulfatase activity